MQYSIELFNSLINRNYWEEQNKTVLDVQNYSHILMFPYAHVGRNQGKQLSQDYDIVANYYYNIDQGVALSQTSSTKYPSAIEYPSLISRLAHPKQISISTYMDHHGHIVQLNRFDLKGRDHQNNTNIFTGTEKRLCDIYFTNFAPTPHLHFQTQFQALNLPKEPNAISLKNLSTYLEDLLNVRYQELLKYDLGMPFLKYYQQNIEYNQTFLKYLKKIIAKWDNSQEASSKEVANMLNQIVNHYDVSNTMISQISPGKLSIMQMHADIQIYQELAEAFPNDLPFIYSVGRELLNSLTANQHLSISKNIPYNPDLNNLNDKQY